MSRNGAENQPYAERALWAVLAPAAVLGPCSGRSRSRRPVEYASRG
ncbi:hypothetical protein SAFG77S_02616 [Streptomyces afghaniensis]|nr:hypothetical protein [Streptomyces sp. HP-A2021]